MSYSKGFDDAVELFEMAVNDTIKAGVNNLDRIITMLFVCKLKKEELLKEYEDSVIERLDCDDDCDCVVFTLDELINQIMWDINKAIVNDMKKQMRKGDGVDE